MTSRCLSVLVAILALVSVFGAAPGSAWAARGGTKARREVAQRDGSAAHSTPAARGRVRTPGTPPGTVPWGRVQWKPPAPPRGGLLRRAVSRLQILPNQQNDWFLLGIPPAVTLGLLIANGGY